MPGPRLLPALAAGLLLSQTGCLALENRFVYHPVRDSNEDLSPSESMARDVYLATADGAIHARWCPRAGSTGAILYCHGNAGNLERRGREVHELWQALGESVLIFDYPGYGRSKGAPSEAGCYASAEAAYNWLVKEAKVPPEWIIIYGESLGGGVATELAARVPHRALVIVRTFTSLPGVAQAKLPLLPVKAVMQNRFDNAGRLPRCGRPVFIAQADADRLIPFEHGRQLQAACGGPAQLFVLRRLGHNDPLPPEFYEQLRTFLDRRAGIGP